MSNVIYLEDRSGCETDDECGMRYWWNRLEGERGITPVQESIYLTIGRDVHEDFAVLAAAPDLSLPWIQDQVARIMQESNVDPMRIQDQEDLYRRLGWFVANALYIEPGIRERYSEVFMEDEIILDRTPLWIAVTPDRILRDRVTGRLVYREYKSTLSASKKWTDSWVYAIQLHLGLLAVAEELGEEPAYAQIMGLLKGDRYGARLSHPYVYGWFNESQDQWSAVYRAGNAWVPRGTWEFPGGIVAWVQFCGVEVARSQFPHSMPVFLNRAMVKDFVIARTHRSEEIHQVKEACRTDVEMRNRYFRKKLKTCRPPFGDACPYLQACWHAPTAADPLGSGVYIPRTPHHEVELTYRSVK